MTMDIQRNLTEQRKDILMTASRIRQGLGGAGLVALALGVLALAACDFEVTNPGPVQDEFLKNPAAFGAMVNGGARTLGEGLNYVNFHGAIVAREIHPTGQTGQFGISQQNAVGILREDEQGAPWSNSHQSRWLSENALRQMGEVLSDAEFNSSSLVAHAYMWAGYANRLLGENMCEAVFDGGPAELSSAYLSRAEDQFTKAIQVAAAAGVDSVITASTAARASVRVHLGDWAGARADAAAVPKDFVFTFAFFDIGDTFFFNRIAWASMNQPYKAHTIWGTFYEQYFRDTDDPRISWMETTGVGTGALDCCGAVPWFPQTKFGRLGGFNLSTGREMSLIEAEGLLGDGMWPEAMAVINELRADVGVPGVGPWVATSLVEAWGFLKRERGIELWMEGRRLGDLRRWADNATPGALDPLEVVGDASHLIQQDLCFPIPTAETDTNPNLG